MPFVLVIGIIIDTHRRAEGCAAIGAAREHHFGKVPARREYAGKHVNVIVSGATGTVHGHERLAGKSYSIYSAATQVTAHVHGSDSVEGRCLVAVLRIARAKAVKLVGLPADKQVAVGVHVEGSPLRRVWKIKRCLPGDSAAVGGPAEVSAVAGEEAGPELVLK